MRDCMCGGDKMLFLFSSSSFCFHCRLVVLGRLKKQSLFSLRACWTGSFPQPLHSSRYTRCTLSGDTSLPTYLAHSWIEHLSSTFQETESSAHFLLLILVDLFLGYVAIIQIIQKVNLLFSVYLVNSSGALCSFALVGV